MISDALRARLENRSRARDGNAGKILMSRKEGEEPAVALDSSGPSSTPLTPVQSCSKHGSKTVRRWSSARYHRESLASALFLRPSPLHNNASARTPSDTNQAGVTAVLLASQSLRGEPLANNGDSDRANCTGPKNGSTAKGGLTLHQKRGSGSAFGLQ